MFSSVSLKQLWFFDVHCLLKALLVITVVFYGVKILIYPEMHLTLPSLSSTPSQNVFRKIPMYVWTRTWRVCVETKNNLAMGERAGEVLIADEECRFAQVNHADWSAGLVYLAEWSRGGLSEKVPGKNTSRTVSVLYVLTLFAHGTVVFLPVLVL